MDSEQGWSDVLEIMDSIALQLNFTDITKNSFVHFESFRNDLIK